MFPGNVTDISRLPVLDHHDVQNGVWCVAVLLWHPDGGRCAAVTRKEDSSKLCLPGGKIDRCDLVGRGRYPALDPPETFARAASRELCEETGAALHVSCFSFVFGTNWYSDRQRFTVTMWARPDGARFEPTLRGEPGSTASWVAPEVLCRDKPGVDGRSGAYPDYYPALFEKIGVRSPGRLVT